MAESKAAGLLEEESIQSVGTEERKVIFASSLGTVFEWYDFYLYAVLAPFFARFVLSPGKPDGRVAVGIRRVRRRLPRAPVRGARVRSHRRPRGQKIHVPRDHRLHGWRDLPRRLAADVRVDRLVCADIDGHAASRAGPRAGRRVRRCGNLRRGACAAQPTRLRHGLDPDHRDARVVPCASVDLSVPQQHGREGVRRMGLADSVLAVADPARVLGLYPAQAARVSDLPEDEGRRQRVEVAAAPTASSSIRTTSTCCSRCSARPPARVWSGTRGSSMRCSSLPSRSSSTTCRPTR